MPPQRTVRPMDERAFAEVQESSWVAPSNCWRLKNTYVWIWMHWKGKEGQFDFTCTTPPPRQHTLVLKETTLDHDFSLGESESMRMSTQDSPGKWVAVQEDHFFFTSSRELSHELYYLGQGRCWQNFEQIKAMNFKLTFSGMCLEWKGVGCELRVGGDWLGRDRSVFLPSGSHLGKRQWRLWVE